MKKIIIKIICIIITVISGLFGTFNLLWIIDLKNNYRYEKESDLYIEPVYNWYIHGQSLIGAKFYMILSFFIFIVFLIISIKLFKTNKIISNT